MVPDRKAARGRRNQQRQKVGAHRKSRKGRSILTRTVAAGGAAMAIGAAYEVTAPTAQALTIRFIGPAADGTGSTNTTEINLFEGNIFNPQFGIGGAGSSNNIIGNIAVNLGNQIISAFLDVDLNFGTAATGTGNGNVVQVNLFSYNIFNPQFTLGANVSNNTTVNNVSMNNGNGSTTAVGAGGLPLIGGAVGNGNTVQISMFSGNIFNPQWGASNTSNNTATTNVSVGNGNGSTSSLFGGLFGGLFFGGGGNGNTTQFGLFVSNIWNPQFAFGAGNVSNNTSTTNTATNNGNDSSNTVTGGVLGTVAGGTTGNGNVNQGASGSGNIWNDQVNIGTGSTPSSTSNNTVTTGSQQPPPPPVIGSTDNEVDINAMAQLDSQSGGGDSGTQTLTGSDELNTTGTPDSTPTPTIPETTAPGTDETAPATADVTNGDGGGGDGSGGGDTGGSNANGDSGA